MSREATAGERFASLVDTFVVGPDVSEGRMFGSPGLKTGGKVFAMLVKDRLVLKLSAGRVTALVAAGAGEPFDPGHGRLLKEWIAVHCETDLDWHALATEARSYVSGEFRERSAAR